MGRLQQQHAPLAGWEDGEGTMGGIDPAADAYSFAVVGDLHLDPDHGSTAVFSNGREDVVRALGNGGGSKVVFQLGDLGAYGDALPGSLGCFKRARAFLESFGLPYALVVGNHDLEGTEFETDVANLEAWSSCFRLRHYWAAEVGHTVCIGLSTVRFRGNSGSVHEVHVDDEQLEWFRGALLRYAGRPVFVFTHAPPAGSGLRAVRGVHVQNRCAWLNHTTNASVFSDLAAEHNVKLWFSGHFHLSHNYADAISVVGGTAYVQTGVMGECNRDGLRQSRVLKGDRDGYRLYTLDHDTGDMRLDLEHAYASGLPPVPREPPPPPAAPEPLGPSPACRGDGGKAQGSCGWLEAGGELLRHEEGLVVEYDARLRAPMGVVCTDVGDRRVRLVGPDGAVLASCHGGEVAAATGRARAAEHVEAVELVAEGGRVSERIERNSSGRFYRVFQGNKWQARLRAEAEARERGGGGAAAA